MICWKINIDDLNKHFITTANRLLKSEHLELQDMLKTLESLPDQTSKANFNYNTSHMNELKKNSKIFVYTVLQVMTTSPYNM